jgi:hypothetical protein
MAHFIFLFTQLYGRYPYRPAKLPLMLSFILKPYGKMAISLVYY